MTRNCGTHELVLKVASSWTHGTVTYRAHAPDALQRGTEAAAAFCSAMPCVDADTTVPLTLLTLLGSSIRRSVALGRTLGNTPCVPCTHERTRFDSTTAATAPDPRSMGSKLHPRLTALARSHYATPRAQILEQGLKDMHVLSLPQPTPADQLIPPLGLPRGRTAIACCTCQLRMVACLLGNGGSAERRCPCFA